VADAHDAQPAQIALAWLVAQPRVVVIPGASSVAQLESNVAAAEITLAEDELAALTAAARSFQPLSGMRTLAEGVRERVDDLMQHFRG
jgi:aryl-alcohol dehydrogenase-like predicted oxidoreductase